MPVLWDTKENRAVNNESAEVIRMLNSEFDEFAENPDLDLYPEELRDEIDELNDRIYNSINNGVYRTGFASTQEAYEEAFVELFEALDWVDDILGGKRYLTGDTITEADWRLFVTLVRFDAVYVGHFKCNQRRIADYDNLSGYLRDLYQQPGIARHGRTWTTSSATTTGRTRRSTRRGSCRWVRSSTSTHPRNGSTCRFEAGGSVTFRRKCRPTRS